MIKTTTQLCVLLACAAAFAGCRGQDRVKGPKTSAPDPFPLAAYPNVLLRGRLDQQLVLMGDPIVIPAGNQVPMQVRVRLRNITDRDFYVQYRFRFYGPDREVLDENIPWREVEVASTHDVTLAANAIQMRASEWELEVR